MTEDLCPINSYTRNTVNLETRAQNIRIVATDIDGVLTDGRLYYPMEGGPHCKAFHVRDGAAIKWLQAESIPVAFITGLISDSVRQRAEDLAILDCFMGVVDKTQSLEILLEKYQCTWDQVAYLGDDLPDLPILQRVGLAACPSDACAEVRARVHHIFPEVGGSGVLRSLAEMILKARGIWESRVTHYEPKH